MDDSQSVAKYWGTGPAVSLRSSQLAKCKIHSSTFHFIKKGEKCMCKQTSTRAPERQSQQVASSYKYELMLISNSGDLEKLVWNAQNACPIQQAQTNLHILGEEFALQDAHTKRCTCKNEIDSSLTLCNKKHMLMCFCSVAEACI
jgi:hypothetical protein